MKLIELVQHLENLNEAELLLSKEFPDVEFDLVELYMNPNINIDSNIKFVNIDEVPDDTHIELEGIQYVDFLPLHLVQEMVEEYKKSSEKYSDHDIAIKILNYRINDA